MHSPFALKNYYVTLKSNDFPGNSGANFICPLPQPLHLPRNLYDVGILNITYNTTDKSEDSMQLDQQTKLLFPHLKPPVIKNYTYNYEKRNKLNDFFMHFNRRLAEMQFPAALELWLAKSDKEFIVQIQNRGKKNILFPVEIAEFLGFRRRMFEPGSHTGESVCSESNLIGLKSGDYILETIDFPDKQNLITLDRMYEELLYVAYKGEEPKQFFEKIVRNVNTEGHLLQLEMTPEEKFNISLKSGREYTNEYIVFPQKLVAAMGLDRNKFNVGKYESVGKLQRDLFAEIQKKEKLYFKFGRRRNLLLPMNEPSSLDYQKVLEEINKTFSKWKLDDLRPNFKVQDGKLYAENLEDGVELPQAVIKFFEIPEETVITAEEKVDVGETIVEEEREKEIKTEEQPIQTTHYVSQRILILSDVVENQMYGMQMLPTLGQLPYSDKKNVFETFKSVLYVPLSSEHVYYIRVQLVDEFTAQLSNIKDTQLTLHFKPRIH